MFLRAPVPPAVLYVFLCLALTGCQTERGPTIGELDRLNRPSVAPHPSSLANSTVDDAQRVTEACGRPSYDGPVRRMVYHGRHEITLEFIPSRPIARVTDVPAPFPHQPVALPLELPANAVWRFDDARMEEEDLLISRRIKVYLPCAANALSYEY